MIITPGLLLSKIAKRIAAKMTMPFLVMESVVSPVEKVRGRPSLFGTLAGVSTIEKRRGRPSLFGTLSGISTIEKSSQKPQLRTTASVISTIEKVSQS